MKRTGIGLVMVVLALGLGALALKTAASAAVTTGSVADHALIDQTGGDAQISCRTTNSSPFNVYLSMRAFGGAVTMRVHFQDGDWVDYPLQQDQVFSLQQAAGDTDHVDNVIRVTKASGLGSLVGWMSASRIAGSGSFVRCDTV